ncbi:MAG: COP23 domain-containing protein [Pseudanabaena sp.]|jgi:hypothetical protein
MKTALKLVRVVIAILPVLMTVQSLQAQEESQPRFVCGKDDQGSPATLVMLPDGSSQTVIRYVSGAFENAGFSNQKRCEEISDRFQYFNEKREINYMAVGKINGQSVICVTRQEGGDCSRDLKGEGLLITTRPGINPSKTLADLINVRMEAGSALTETRDLTRKTSINSVNTKCLIEASTQSSYDECVKGSPSAAGSVPRSSNPATPSKRPLW